MSFLLIEKILEPINNDGTIGSQDKPKLCKILQNNNSHFVQIRRFLHKFLNINTQTSCFHDALQSDLVSPQWWLIIVSDSYAQNKNNILQLNKINICWNRKKHIFDWFYCFCLVLLYFWSDDPLSGDQAPFVTSMCKL